MQQHAQPVPQVTVLDAGGQYCHLISRKVREFGVYADVKPSETPAQELQGRKGIIISGGPASVYEAGTPTIDPGILQQGTAVLGICYGLQLMALHLGGKVQKGEKGEYGLATLQLRAPNALMQGSPQAQQVWMSHRDAVAAVPPGYTIFGATDTCSIAGMVDPTGKLYGVQFHPEVVHTPHGRTMLSNFLFNVCGCEQDWNPRHQVAELEREIRETTAHRNIFFFVSGGVDSAVAYTLCLRALGGQRVTGLYVDTGLMRKGETEFVRETFDAIAPGSLEIEHAQEQFLGALEGVRDPEEKRRIIGEQFVKVQERILASHHFLDGHWILGQGTIYPDTIESGGTAKASVIKTHHNRVPGIQALIERNALIEPLRFFYKDEVRVIGRELGLPSELLDRHPFPGPGLAIRCLCVEEAGTLTRCEEGWELPVHSVGVQGDERSYRRVLALDPDRFGQGNPHELATELINRYREINRVVKQIAARTPLTEMRAFPSAMSAERLNRLREADAIVRTLSQEAGYEQTIWQFPVILIPLGTEQHPDAIVLRPVHSVDGMTAQAVDIEPNLEQQIGKRILAEVNGVSAVFCDLTHKPPGTIEWE
jgi:GMP synthase (glutamine-hydrolysing)